MMRGLSRTFVVPVSVAAALLALTPAIPALAASRYAAAAQDRPEFTPYTVAPAILNRDEVVQALIRAYPVELREAGIGGRVNVWFHIDAEGLVQTRLIDASSGYESLNQAAMSVASVYRFSPALNDEERVAVWISLPITFQVR